MNCPQCKLPIPSGDPKSILKHVMECTGWSIDTAKQRLYNIGILSKEDIGK